MAGNLGDYQLLTTLAKKVGGPRVLIAIALGVGGVIVEGGRIIATKAAPGVKAAIKKRKPPSKVEEKVYTVSSRGDAGGGLVLDPGNQFRALQRDGDSYLIEVLGNDNNPYFASGKLLASISDFEHAT